MTQIQALENMSQPEVVALYQELLQRYEDDMDMLSKELADRPPAKIDRPMAIGCGRFGVGVSASTVLNAAASHYNFVTNEKREQDRIELGKLKADNFMKYGAPTDLEIYKAWLEKVSNSTSAASALPIWVSSEIRVGRLPTVNQDEYPGLGDWWVQIRIGPEFDEVLARVYGDSPQQAVERAQELASAAAVDTSATCTCPSGDGSLRWPCPVHPPEI